MGNVIEFLKKHKVLLVIIVGCMIRIIGIFTIGGLNQDEAFAGYEAYSLLHYGVDSHGMHWPVYFVSWGSGMNVLNSYLMIPFVAIFGAKAWVIRLPQLIVACISLPVFYLTLKKMINEKFALIGLVMLSICPWHIVLASWGLESNLLPGFLLFGTYFLIKQEDGAKNLCLSALFFGLSLYCYSAIWPVIPVLIVGEIAYLFYVKKIHITKYLFAFVGILVVFALPLVLFLLINKGYMNQIDTKVFSIPKLVAMRSDEISLDKVGDNLSNMFGIIIKQDDGLYSNTTKEFGLYYKGMLIFALIGLIAAAKRVYYSFKKRECEYITFAYIGLLTAIILGALISVNVNRINCIHMPIIVFISYGIKVSIEWINKKVNKNKSNNKERERKVGQVIALVLAGLLFTSFTIFFTTTYKNNISTVFGKGLDKALDYAKEQAKGREINIDNTYYSTVLFYTKYPVKDYIATVEYTNYPSEYLDISGYKGYKYGIQELSTDNIYVLSKDCVLDNMEGFVVKKYDNFAVVHGE